MLTSTIDLLSSEQTGEVVRRLDALGLTTMAAAVRAGDVPDVAAVVGHPLLAMSAEELTAPGAVLAYLEALPEDVPPRCAFDGHRPDDDPAPGDRCKDCGRDIVWVGPSFTHDWALADRDDPEHR